MSERKDIVVTNEEASASPIRLCERFIDRVKYPSNYGVVRRLLSMYLLPSFFIEMFCLVFSAGTSAEFSTGVFAEPPSRVLDDLVKQIAIINGIQLAPGFLLTSGLACREVKNRVLFGKYLTVGKVATRDSPFFSKVVPIGKNYRYYGELHFEGNKLFSTPDYSKSPPTQIVKEGVKGLSGLATACQNRDPRLEGLEVFSGSSHIVQDSLKTLGFTICDYPNVKGPPSVDTPRICYITREDLIKNQGLYQRFIG